MVYGLPVSADSKESDGQVLKRTKMSFVIYWLISEDGRNTYIGFSNNVRRRVKEHRAKKVKTTEYFGKFRCFILDRVDNLEKGIIREKYWKSHTGRIKLKSYFIKIVR
ncbi:MAG: GIY-YIG nuclease family protein [Patescibacteria group bacterium]